MIRIKQLNNSFAIPEFGLGTWMMGGGRTVDPENDDAGDIAALKAGIEKGFTHIDTAEMYAAGHAEELVSGAIKGYDREKLFIASKVWNDNLSYEGVQKAAESSLKRLGTDYLDLYMIHKPNDEFPLEETVKSLDKLVDRGLIRNIGVSNFAVARLDQARKYSVHGIKVNQVHYNLLNREPETSGLLEYCQVNNIMLSAWRPLQKGGLLDAPCELLLEISRKYDKTPAQIAINWLLSQPNVVTMSTMRNPAHIDENLGATGWNMDEADIELLRKEIPGQNAISDNVPLS